MPQPRARTRNALCPGIVGVALGVLVPGEVTGQDAPQRVEITGSSIKGIAAETASPMSVIRAEDLLRAGVTTAEQALRRIAANQSAQGVSQGVGEITGGIAEADLRGLGAEKTLVLLNGRRIANHAYDAGAVDLNVVPMSAIDRIDVLREGASALYGSGAVSGVVNFVLRRRVTGLEVSAESEMPRNTGGDMARVSATAGFGTADGFSAFATLDHRRQQAIEGTDRAFSKSGLLRGPDEFLTSGTSFPGDLDGFEPSLAAGCAPPRSIPDLDGKSCRYDFVGDIDLVPRNEQTTLLSQATLALGPEHQGMFEYLRAENRTLARQTPTPTSMRLPDTSPYWIAGRPSTEFEDGGRGGIANWLIVPAGRRANQTQAVAQRVLLSVEGRVGGFDYQAGLARSTSTVTDALTDGYLSFDRVQQALLDGVINPFGPQTAEGAAAIEAAQLRGRLLQAKGEVTSFDARTSTQLMPLDGGALAVSLGVEAGRESFHYDLQPLAAENASEGLEFAVDARGSRTAAALYAEVVAPLTQTLQVSLAARHDRYSDSGDRLSPKLSARWQPQAQLLLRGSVGRGFRAPTLYEVHLPQQLALSGDSYDDPQLCPDGRAVAGASSAVVCDQQVLRRFGGPAGYGQPAGKLRPETSKGLSFGLVFEPSERMTVGIDLWDIRLQNEIDELSEEAIFDQPARYASRIVRCSQLGAAQRADIGVCLNYPAFDPIAFVDAPIENLGDIKTSGVDLALALSSGSTPMASFRSTSRALTSCATGTAASAAAPTPTMWAATPTTSRSFAGSTWPRRAGRPGPGARPCRSATCRATPTRRIRTGWGPTRCSTSPSATPAFAT